MSFREIHPRVPTTCLVSGCIVESDDARNLSQDMLDVQLPNGLLVTAGWYPDGCPNGTYVVRVQRGLEYLAEPYTTLLADEASAEVERLVARNAKPEGTE